MGRFISSVINIFQSRWVTVINVGEDRGVCMDPYPRVSTLLFPPNFVLPTPAPFFPLFFFRVPPPQIQIFCQSPPPPPPHISYPCPRPFPPPYPRHTNPRPKFRFFAKAPPPPISYPPVTLTPTPTPHGLTFIPVRITDYIHHNV